MVRFNIELRVMFFLPHSLQPTKIHKSPNDAIIYVELHQLLALDN
jgi:hypothetical protein